MKQAQLTVDYSSKNSISKVKKDWTSMAKELVEVEYLGGAYYGFCSELAAYRLLAIYGYQAALDGNVRVGKGRLGWYFMLNLEAYKP